MKVDLSKELLCLDKEDGKVYKITGIFLPLGKLSGKDITIEIEDDLDEWRSIDDIELLEQGGDN